MKNKILLRNTLLNLSLGVLSIEHSFAGDDLINDGAATPVTTLIREPREEIPAAPINPDYMPLSESQTAAYLMMLQSDDHAKIMALARVYMAGTHGTKNLSVAHTLMTKAAALKLEEIHKNTEGYDEAASGDPVAQHNFGFSLIKSEKGTVWVKKGYEWLLKAAAQNYAPTLNELGCAYLSGVPGTFITEEPKLAVTYFQGAADLGHEQAIKLLKIIEEANL
jgi:TPR repeat protein